MVKRRVVVDGGEPFTVEPGATIGEVLGKASKEGVPPSVVTAGGQVITPEDYDQPAPPHGMITNATPITKGATLRERMLDQEFDLIVNRFLQEFPDGRCSLELNDNTLIFRGWPLPDDYTPDRVDLLIVTCGYPDVPPAGVHIPSKTRNRDQIVKHLGGHVMADIPPSLRDRVEELTEYGWHWICYHYRNWSWRLNQNNLLAGDCLYKWVILNKQG